MIDTAALRLQLKRTIRAMGGNPVRKALNNYMKRAAADKMRERVYPVIAVEAEQIDVDIEELVEREARAQTPFIDAVIQASIEADTTPESIFKRDIAPGELALEELIMEATGDGSLQNDIVQDVLSEYTPNDLTVCSFKVPMSSMKLSETTVVDAVGEVRVKLVKEYAPGKTETKYPDYDVLVWTKPVVSKGESGGETVISDDGLVSIMLHFKNKTSDEAPLHVFMSLNRERRKFVPKLSSYGASKAFGKVHGGEMKVCAVQVAVDTEEVVEITFPALEKNGAGRKWSREHMLVNNNEPDDSLVVKLFIMRLKGSGRTISTGAFVRRLGD